MGTLKAMTIVGVASMPVSALATENTTRIAANAKLLEVARPLVDADVGIVVLGRVVSARDLVGAYAGAELPTNEGE